MRGPAICAGASGTEVGSTSRLDSMRGPRLANARRSTSKSVSALQPRHTIGSLSCATTGSPTGKALGYDALRRLISWQNASSLPTATAAYAYDGEGQRVWQQTTTIAAVNLDSGAVLGEHLLAPCLELLRIV